jgi:hypothetical protein
MEEAWMAIAETLKVTNRVDDTVNKVDDKVDRVDGKVDRVDDKVTELIDGREKIHFPSYLRIPDHGFGSKQTVCE